MDTASKHSTKCITDSMTKSAPSYKLPSTESYEAILFYFINLSKPRELPIQLVHLLQNV